MVFRVYNSFSGLQVRFIFAVLFERVKEAETSAVDI